MVFPLKRATQSNIVLVGHYCGAALTALALCNAHYPEFIKITGQHVRSIDFALTVNNINSKLKWLQIRTERRLTIIR